ncbi:MAG: metallophosphoesterase, partial [bacterium]|nr:metallophosphoesterase [bacterium]
MKIIHISDTHLGFSEYFKIDPVSGINQREQDFYNAWNYVVDEIIRQRPDFVVHAGDLFHSSRPVNRAIAVALEGIQKISDAGIPFVAISGNHSTPKIRATGSIFESISLLPNVFASFRSQYEKFLVNGCAIHCVPHCSLTEELERAFQSIQVDSDNLFNILITHGAWAGNRQFSMGEFNEQHIQDPEINQKLKFDYIALGHYHKHLKIKPHAVYSGATERTSFNEAGNSTGFVMVDLETLTIEYHETPSRPMIRLAAVDCSDLNSQDIYAQLEKLSTPQLTDALVTLHLNNVQHDTLIQLENREIDAIFQHVFYLNKTLSQTLSGSSQTNDSLNLVSLPMEFERYLANVE